MNLLRRNSRPKEGKENAPSQLPKPASDAKPKLGLRQQPEPVQEQSAPPLQEAPMQQRRSRRPRPAAFPPEPILSPIRGPVASAPSTAGAGEDRVTLEDWSFAFNASRPLQLTGRIFNNGSGYEDGDLLEYTSQIISINNRSAVTKSGTVYRLGKPSASFDQLRKQLWINSRTGALGRDDGSSVPPMDEDQPLLGIKLGEVTATAPVRLPRVPGWSHQSGVALLNEWSTEKTGSGFVSVVGSVFNCPGAYDGAESHQTATVVDCRGRMLITVEGAEYYLGYRKESESEEREGLVAHEISANDRGALGLVDDLLAV